MITEERIFRRGEHVLYRPLFFCESVTGARGVGQPAISWRRRRRRRRRRKVYSKLTQ